MGRCSGGGGLELPSVFLPSLCVCLCVLAAYASALGGCVSSACVLSIMTRSILI